MIIILKGREQKKYNHKLIQSFFIQSITSKLCVHI